VARSKEELTEIVNAYLENPDLDSDGRKRVVEQQCYKVDGMSLERMLKYLVEFLYTPTDDAAVDNE